MNLKPAITLLFALLAVLSCKNSSHDPEAEKFIIRPTDSIIIDWNGFDTSNNPDTTKLKQHEMILISVDHNENGIRIFRFKHSPDCEVCKPK